MKNRKYFASWSGDLSWEVAQHLMVLFKQLLPVWDGWISKQDMRDTRDWLSQLIDGLKDLQLEFGVVVLTKANLHRDWVLFETGALMMRLGFTRVVPVLVDLGPGDLLGHPLEKFQARGLDRDDVQALVWALNESTEGARMPANWLRQNFEKYFPEWHERLQDILVVPRPDTPPSLADATRAIADGQQEIIRLLKEKDQPPVPATELRAPQRQAVELLHGAIGEEPVDPVDSDAQPDPDGPSGLHLWERWAAANRRGHDPES